MVKRTKPSYAVMTNLYDTIRDLFKDKQYYYNSEEEQQIRKDKSNVIITRKEN